jgi:hypothetical protein
MQRSWCHSVVILGALSTACTYDIRPSVAVVPARVAGLERRSERVRLVLTEDYRTFESTDRGHAFSDPQRYRIGPSLAELTKRYFRAAFCEVILTAPESDGVRSDFTITPEVVSFDNDLTFDSLRQRFEIVLAASVVDDSSARALGRVSARGTHEHGIAPIRDDESRIGKLLSLAMQDALAELLQDVVREIDSARPRDSTRPCAVP